MILLRKFFIFLGLFIIIGSIGASEQKKPKLSTPIHNWDIKQVDIEKKDQGEIITGSLYDGRTFEIYQPTGLPPVQTTCFGNTCKISSPIANIGFLRQRYHEQKNPLPSVIRDLPRQPYSSPTVSSYITSIFQRIQEWWNTKPATKSITPAPIHNWNIDKVDIKNKGQIITADLNDGRTVDIYQPGHGFPTYQKTCFNGNCEISYPTVSIKSLQERYYNAKKRKESAEEIKKFEEKTRMKKAETAKQRPQIAKRRFSYFGGFE